MRFIVIAFFCLNSFSVYAQSLDSYSNECAQLLQSLRSCFDDVTTIADYVPQTSEESEIYNIATNGEALGFATVNISVECVSYLLEKGADVNIPYCGATPLKLILVEMMAIAIPPPDGDMEYSDYIQDEDLRNEKLMPMRHIRDLLLAHGAISDNSMRVKMECANTFKAYLGARDENTIYALCEESKIVLKYQDAQSQVNIPPNIEQYEVWTNIAESLCQWFDAQVPESEYSVAIVGPNAVDMTVMRPMKRMCEEKGIAVSMYEMPSSLVCSGYVLFEMFTNPSNVGVDDAELFDRYCPVGIADSFSAELKEQLLAL